jgi:hypothetical protein
MDAASIVDGYVAVFGRKLRSLVAETDQDLVGAVGFESFLSSLRSTLDGLGRDVVADVLSRKDEAANTVVRGAAVYRFKESVTKEWLTPFGRVQIPRRYFQRDTGGDGIYPLDENVGMVEKFMSPDLEEISAFASGLVTPSEVHQLLSKTLSEAPSRKAIQRIVADVGSFVEDHEPLVLSAIRKERPLSTDGNALVVSWDGTCVPLLPKAESREPCDLSTSGNGSKRAAGAFHWGEAGVATISTYARGDGAKIEPGRLDARYLARMPEPLMLGLVEQIESLPNWLLEPGAYREILVIADGKHAIWDEARRIDWLKDARFVLDFYHAAEHVGVVGEVLFGAETKESKRWTSDYCHRIKHERRGVDAMVRSIRYHSAKVSLTKAERATVTRELKYFLRYRSQMNYAELRERGLPIGSGPVEAACKNIVGARLKRSGMRWSNRGGQQVLNLRTHIKSGTWDVVWSTYLSRKVA